ncbi:alkaline phosphatase D family protein [Tepidiforma sp.]|uniref:alkaline phosphatase D family protein n=1 Tax=Tepidiforma sp. TaxID=2682230 RepID=UPI002ADD9100|nr:alkaline phosphatase D family protein [Tepidiforma sp.]
MAAPRATRILAVVLALVGLAAILIASFERAGEPALLERPWEASALSWAALVSLFGTAAFVRRPAFASFPWLATAWSVVAVAWLGSVPLVGIAGASVLILAAALSLAPAVARSPRPVLTRLAGFVALCTLLTGVGVRVHQAYLGPTHPASPLRHLPVELVEWAWSGAVTQQSFAVTARLASTASGITPELIVRASDGSEVARVPPTAVSPARIARFEPTGLQPATRYRWSIAIGGREDRSRTGTVQTYPDGAATFTLAFGACARTGSSGQVFDRIREANPLLFVHTGDFHYADIDEPDPKAIRDAFTRSLRAPAQQALWLDVPVAYTWDDHDYGGNDSDRTTASREAARAVYREIVPHYPLPLDGPIAQAFTIGRVRVILTDTRSERAPSHLPDGPSKSMLGAPQLAWLFDELLAARDSAALTIWVNSVPWISNETRSDNWGAYAEERRRISDFLVENGIRNLVMISGDAHMLAADSGANNLYASNGAGPGFPVYHAAALDRRGSLKGGPYTEGAHPGGGQFGLLTIEDRDTEILVTFSGRNWRGEELIHHRTVFPVPRR